MSHRLVLQAHNIETRTLKEIARMTGSRDILAIQHCDISHQAFRLAGANIESRIEVASRCAFESIDFAFMPSEVTLGDIGLIAMDMDSTLITIECIDEIADMCGIKEQVAAITERSMRGELDFSASLTERVKLLTGLETTALERVYETRLQLTTGAVSMLRALHDGGAQSLLVSGGFTYFTDRLRTALNLTRAVGNVLGESAGKLTGQLIGDIVDARRKADELVKMRDALSGKARKTIAIGDGANDLAMLATADFGIAFHAKPVVHEQAAYAINYLGLDAVIGMFA